VHTVTSMIQALTLSRPVNTSDTDGIFLSEKAWFQTTGSGYFRVLSDSRQSDIWFDVLCYMPSHGTLFPLHEACIETSCRVIDHRRTKRNDLADESSLAVLCRLLNARFLGRRIPLSNVDMANDILDLCTSSSSYGPRSVLAMTKLEWWGGEYDVHGVHGSCLSPLTFRRDSTPTLLTSRIISRLLYSMCF
jgi:hypothetical protein